MIKNGTSAEYTSHFTLSVNTSGERGLIGAAVDPNFRHPPIIISTCIIRIHQGRITGLAVSRLAPMTWLQEKPPYRDPLTHTVASIINGGGLAFGLDGKLFVAVGENKMGSNSTEPR